MGRTVEQLKAEMSEREFYLHCMQMDHDPDPEDRSAYYIQLLTVLMNRISGSGLLFKEPLLKTEILFPWGKDRENRDRSTSGDSQRARD